MIILGQQEDMLNNCVLQDIIIKLNKHTDTTKLHIA